MGLLEVLGRVGNVLDLPGSSLRDVLMGEDPFDQWGSMTTGENRATGRDLLRSIGLAGEEDTTANAIGGILTEMLVDPLNLIGGALLGRKAFQRAGVRRENKLIRKRVEPKWVDEYESGFPAEVPRDELEDVLYHVSPHGKEIEEAGRILALTSVGPRRKGLEDLVNIKGEEIFPHSPAGHPLSPPSGLGGASYPGVSMTTEWGAAEEIQRWYQGADKIRDTALSGGSIEDVSRVTKEMTQEVADYYEQEVFSFMDPGLEDDALHLDEWDAVTSSLTDKYNLPPTRYPRWRQNPELKWEHDRWERLLENPEEAAKQFIESYLEDINRMQRMADLHSPIKHQLATPFSDAAKTAESLAGIQSGGTRIFEVPVESMPDWMDLAHGQDWNEIRALGDVPLEGATVYGPKRAYEFSSYQRVPRMSPLIKSLLAERLINKGLNQFQGGE